MAKRDYTESSGNVFADLEIPNAEEMLAKADLALKIADILQHRGLTQIQAAEVLGVDQPKVSALIRGRISGFSIERLLRFLLLLGSDVSITVKPHVHLRAKSRTRTVGSSTRMPRKGILTVDDFVAVKASKSNKKLQAEG